jgi:hypothetical protein
MSSPLNGSTKRLRKKMRQKKVREDFVSLNPTPYGEWDSMADYCRRKVHIAVEAIKPDLRWVKGKSDRDRTMTITDLAIGYWAVSANERKGLSYGQLDCCFRVCCGRGCHRAKASAVLAVLQTLDLIRKVGNYRAGVRGNIYEPVPERFNEEDLKLFARPARTPTHNAGQTQTEDKTIAQ